MANICSTYIKFYSKDKERLEAMRQKFESVIDAGPTEKNDWGGCWMGNFANVFFPEYGAERVDCKGYVDGPDAELSQVKDYYMFGLWTQTAWSAKIGIWYNIVKKFYPNVKIAYIADECAMGYFVKWDETPDQLFFPEEYYVDGCLPKGNGGCEYIEDKLEYGSIGAMYDYFDEILPFDYRHTENLDELEREIQSKLDEYEKANACNECLYVQIEKYEEVNPADFEFLM